MSPGEELARVLDRIDRERELLAEVVKERKGGIAKLEKRAKELRDRLTGRGGEQLDMEDAATGRALREARDVARREEEP